MHTAEEGLLPKGVVRKGKQGKRLSELENKRERWPRQFKRFFVRSCRRTTCTAQLGRLYLREWVISFQGNE